MSPTTRCWGHLSQVDTRLSKKIVKDPVDAILVEMRSHSGYNGSPVFAFEDVGDRIAAGVDSKFRSLGYTPEPTYIDIDWRNILFLGIDCGHLTTIRRENTNMAVVIPWYKVIELLNSPTLVEEREQIDREVDAAVEPRATPD